MAEFIGNFVIWIAIAVMVYVIAYTVSFMFCKFFEVEFKFENWFSFLFPIGCVLFSAYWYWS